MTEGEGAVLQAAEAERVNQRFAGVGAALGLLIWANLFGIPFGLGWVISRKSHPGLGQFFGFLSVLSVVPGILWVAKSAWGDQWRKALPLARVGPGVLVWTAFCVLAFVPVQLAWLAAVDRALGLPDLPDPISAVGALGVVLGAPLAEEVLFRGYGLARIRELGGEGRALLFTALMFALLHGSWVKLPGTFAIGLFLGWLVLRTGSLWPAILGHFINNGTVLALRRGNLGSVLDATPISWALIGALGTAGLVSLALLGSSNVRRRISELNGAP
ncbi:MAG: type II CAAX endopeptidase family protein [Geothrix sp.]|nr:type II CAAX endopeptidase family protein [Geothrix sp.]